MPRTLALVALALALAAPARSALDPSRLAGMQARAIGPAAMSGRVAAVEGVDANPDVLYAGAANGGVWKSVNGGLTWAPVFDDVRSTASIGAIAVFQANPDVVWVGTGEGNPRNSVAVGDGVYRSLDGGRTWTHLGLAASEHIYRIALHPTDPDVAYVSAMGRLWGENPERGVFKTTDGGKTWRRVLYVDERTGAAELVMDPQNPDKLFAAMWEHRRWPWSFRSGGPGSGLYVTYDGGATWKRLTPEDGLPAGDLGRIGLAISRSNPEIVYALVEAGKSALLRSADGGRSWKTVNDDPRTADRPFYYADIRVDPASPNRVYNLTARLSVSNDGGRTFELLGRSREIHGDYHALWIDPRRPEHLVAGEDGGLGISHDRGATWEFVADLPIGQFYHVTVDMDVPYHVYGGLQDNGCWRGPAALWEEGGIRNQHWDRLCGGDGFETRPDPQDSQRGYAESQMGELVRWNLRTGESKLVRPAEVKPNDPAARLRFNWNTAFAIDPFDPATIYLGSQYVHRSTDRGESWTAISPDLTSNNPAWQKQAESGGLTPDVTGAENFTSLITIAPSPLQRGVIWTGSDDGRVHVTRDGGRSWESVEKNVPGVPASTWVPQILPSRFTPAGAFAVFDNHRRSDWRPYVFRTDDWGKTWTSLATPEIEGWALSIEQDPVDRDLLFLGTERGLWLSTDGGRHWLRWTHGVPATEVAALVEHPRDGDLVIATHGRALYVVDDVTPLRGLTAAMLAEPLHLFPAAAGILYQARAAGGAARGGAGDFRGQNRPYGIQLTYSLDAPGLPLPDPGKERERRGAGEKEPKVEIRIANTAGKLVRKLEGPARLGVNRAVWDLGRNTFRRPPTDNRGRQRDEESGPAVPPGTYRVTIRYKDHEAQGTVRVVADPFTRNTGADWQAREAAIARAGRLEDALVTAIERLRSTRTDLDVVLKKLEPTDPRKAEEGTDANQPLQKAARDLRRKLGEVERRLWIPPGTQGIVDDQTAYTKAEDAERTLETSWDPPNPTHRAKLEAAAAAARTALAAVNDFFAHDVAGFRRQLADARIDLLAPQEPIGVGTP